MATEKTPIACVVLAAGQGTRMKSTLPKVMHTIAGRPMLGHVLDTAQALRAEKTVVVLGPEMEQAETYVAKHPLKPRQCIQQERLGTGHAVQQAASDLANFRGIIVVLYGDTPLIQPQTIANMAEAMREHDAAVAVLGMRPADPALYGRLILDASGNLNRIVEAKDATDSEKSINLCNSGVMAVRGEYLFDWLNRLDNNNASGEYYLTDIIHHAVEEGKVCRVVDAPLEELLGVNDRVQLAEAEQLFQHRLRGKVMREGVTLVDPTTVFLSADSTLGQDVVIEPNVFFGPGVRVADGVTIRGFSHLEGVKVASGAVIGPFARLRPGSEIGKGARVGNFVEIKKATLEKGAKVSHLSYIGDARVGEHSNIGAGTITCNYDGFEKFHTDIGKHAFIGSNTALVAPVSVGDGAMVGAGSVVTEDVEADSLSMSRERQQHKPAWAKEFRRRKRN